MSYASTPESRAATGYVRQDTSPLAQSEARLAQIAAKSEAYAQANAQPHPQSGGWNPQYPTLSGGSAESNANAQPQGHSPVNGSLVDDSAPMASDSVVDSVADSSSPAVGSFTPSGYKITEQDKANMDAGYGVHDGGDVEHKGQFYTSNQESYSDIVAEVNIQNNLATKQGAVVTGLVGQEFAAEITQHGSSPTQVMQDVLSWSKANLSNEERKAVNTYLNSGDVTKVRQGVKALCLRMRNDVPHLGTN